jgi:serine/threonine protein kinase
MPSPTTIDEFLELVRKSGVVDDKRLAAHVEKVRAAGTLPANPSLMAGLLVRDGLLTHFQAEQFLQGKWRRFTIGKYKVLERLGQGGMGSVYLCEHKLMRRRVAVKVLPTNKAEDTSSLERFYREARAVAALDHPNIVRAYDIDQDDKLHFLVMEHVDGSSLQEIIKKAGPLEVLRACHYIRQAALGLQHAHETAGLVHRDIKPGNILVDRNGIVKILDMGLARFFHDEDDLLTKKFEENVLGTADYLAPEQALDSHSVDIRADIYSLGATFYFCLTGRTPFAEGTVAQKLIWHQTRQPKPLRSLRTDVPDGIVSIIDKMMAKDAAQRYPTPAAVAEALAPWTQTPIPPPPDNEMPQLSLAAMGGAMGDSGVGSGTKSPSSGDLGPTPRKMWQVASTATPAPPISPAPRTPATPPTPPSSPREVRTSRPASPPPAPATAPLSSAPITPPNPPVPAPTARIPPPASSPPAPATTSSAPNNGTIPSTRAPTSEPAPPEEAVSWADLAADDSGDKTEIAPPSSRKSIGSSSRRLAGGKQAARSNRRVGVIVIIATSIVVGLVIVSGILALVLQRPPEEKGNKEPPPPLLRVNRRGINGAPQTIKAALENARKGVAHTAVIQVDDDIAESDVIIDDKMPEVTIEPTEAGKTLTWKPSSKATADSKLLRVYKAKGFHLKGFTLDGENRINALVNLANYCPGTRLEGLTLQGFKQYGIWVTNCEGGSKPDEHVVFTGLTFRTTDPKQTAINFDILATFKDQLPKNTNFIVRDCKFEGKGAKIKTSSRATLENVELPTGLQAEGPP